MGANKDKKIYTICGFTGSIQEVGAHFGINYRTLVTRLRAGWTPERAVLTPVNKTLGSKTGVVYSIGKYTNVVNEIEKRFGVQCWTSERRDPKLIIKKIRRAETPKFYKVGNDYTGSLRAISEDFSCPYTELYLGIKNGQSPEEVLKQGGYQLSIK